MKKIFYKLIVSLVLVLLYTDSLLADTPAPPPPGGGGGGTGPEAPASPIDMYVYVLFVVATLFLAYAAKQQRKLDKEIKY